MAIGVHCRRIIISKRYKPSLSAVVRVVKTLRVWPKLKIKSSTLTQPCATAALASLDKEILFFFRRRCVCPPLRANFRENATAFLIIARDDDNKQREEVFLFLLFFFSSPKIRAAELREHQSRRA